MVSGELPHGLLLRSGEHWIHHLVEEIAECRGPQRGEHVGAVLSTLPIGVAHVAERAGRHPQRRGQCRSVRGRIGCQVAGGLDRVADRLVGVRRTERGRRVRGVIGRSPLWNKGTPVSVVVRGQQLGQLLLTGSVVGGVAHAEYVDAIEAGPLVVGERHPDAHAHPLRLREVDQPAHAGIDRKPVRQLAVVRGKADRQARRDRAALNRTVDGPALQDHRPMLRKGLRSGGLLVRARPGGRAREHRRGIRATQVRRRHRRGDPGRALGAELVRERGPRIPPRVTCRAVPAGLPVAGTGRDLVAGQLGLEGGRAYRVGVHADEEVERGRPVDDDLSEIEVCGDISCVGVLRAFRRCHVDEAGFESNRQQQQRDTSRQRRLVLVDRPGLVRRFFPAEHPAAGLHQRVGRGFDGTCHDGASMSGIIRSAWMPTRNGRRAVM